MTPTNEELQDLIGAAESNEFGGCGKLIAHLARAELSRREPVQPQQQDDLEQSDTPAEVVNAPDHIWLTFGDLSEFNGCTVEYADAFRAGDVSWCEDQIEVSDVLYLRADLVVRREPVTVPAELVKQWAEQQWSAGMVYIGPAIDRLQYIANKAAQWALGRE